MTYNAGTPTFTTSDLYTSHPWVHSITTDGNCVLQLELLNTNTFWTASMDQTRKDWQVRMTVRDPLADPTDGNDQITDNWTVSIGHECSEQVLGLTTPTLS